MNDSEIIKKWYAMISTKCNYASIDEDREQLEMLSITLNNLEQFRKSDVEKIKQLESNNSDKSEEIKYLKKQLELFGKIVEHLMANCNNDSY